MPSRSSNGPFPMNKSISEPENRSPSAERIPRNSIKSPKSIFKSARTLNSASETLIVITSSPTTKDISTAVPVVFINTPILAETPVPPSLESPIEARPASWATAPWFGPEVMKTIAPVALINPSEKSAEASMRTLLAAIERASTGSEVGVRRTCPFSKAKSPINAKSPMVRVAPIASARKNGPFLRFRTFVTVPVSVAKENVSLTATPKLLIWNFSDVVNPPPI